ncbi:hypothetical protein C0J52_16060 [Blattella germanica]|nr:hypothetical protein C0J52_16060 [Blattella germanica]
MFFPSRWTQPPTSFTLSKLDTLTDNEEQTPQELLKFETWASFLLDNYPKLAEYICNPQAQSLFSEDISAPYDTEPYDLNQYPAPRCTISSPEELKLNMKINSQEIKSLWNQTKPTHFQEYQSYQIKPTHRRIENPFDTNQILAHRPPPPTLNADVPEFFPKLNLHVTPMLEDENGHKYFPSAHEINDPNELFPYVHVLDKTTTEGENANNFTEIPYTSTTFTVTETTGLQPCSKHSYPSFYPTSISSITGRASQQRFNSNIQHHQVSTSVFNNSHITDDTPLAFSNNTISAPRNIPVFQRPPEFYIQHQDTVANARRQGGGVDYSNLILLTRGGKTHHRGQNVKHPKMNINEMQANLIVPTNHQQSPKTELQQQINDEQENSIPRTKTSIKDEGFRLMEADHFPPIVPSMLTDAISSTPTDVSSITLSTASNQDSTLSHDSTFARSSNTSGVSGKRRLYRDVLANMASVPVITPPATSVAESYVDPRFEELEREALEQYRPSDENLGQSFQQQGASDESISQRFQTISGYVVVCH